MKDFSILFEHLKAVEIPFQIVSQSNEYMNIILEADTIHRETIIYLYEIAKIYGLSLYVDKGRLCLFVHF